MISSKNQVLFACLGLAAMDPSTSHGGRNIHHFISIESFFFIQERLRNNVVDIYFDFITSKITEIWRLKNFGK